MNVSVADDVVGAEIGAAPAAENVFASLVGDVVRKLQDDAALHGGTARLEDLDGAGKRRFGIRFFRMFGVLGLVPGAMDRVGNFVELFPVEFTDPERTAWSRGPCRKWTDRNGRGVRKVGNAVANSMAESVRKLWGRVMDPSRHCIAGSRSDQNFLRSAGSSLMFPMEKMDVCSRPKYVS